MWDLDDYFNINYVLEMDFRMVYIGKEPELEFGKVYDVILIDNLYYVQHPDEYSRMLIYTDDQFTTIENWRTEQIDKILQDSELKF
jgi:hypothetical protein